MNIKHFRNGFIALASCTAIASMAVFAQSKTTTTRGEVTSLDGLVLIAKLQKASYNAGEPVILSVTLKNNGTTPKNYVDRYTLISYKARVFTPDGRTVPFTLYGKEALTRSVSSFAVTSTLKPKEETKVGLMLSRLYDMSVAGTYKVQVRRVVPNPKGGTGVGAFITLVSNVTTIKVNDMPDDVDI